MAARTKKTEKLPEPVRRDGRNCFGIAYFATEADADRYAAWVAEQGRTYNGGFLHGKPCGRERQWDIDGLFAVTE